jgi:hypothetical protein
MMLSAGGRDILRVFHRAAVRFEDGVVLVWYDE